MAAGLAIVVALGGAACGPGAEGRVVYRLAELFEVADSLPSRVSLLPGGPGEAGRLTEGWGAVGPDLPDERWAEGLAAHARFTTLVPADTVLVLEARPFAPPGAPAQTLEVVLNGATVGRLQMQPRWNEYEIEVPAEALRRGDNRLALRFAHALRPADFGDTGDARELAARFRELTIGHGDDGAGEAIPTLEAVHDARGRARVRVSMAAGVWTQVWLQTPRSARLRGRVELGEDAGVDAVAAIEIEDRTGAVRRLLEAELSPGAATEIDVDLSDWGDQIVALRLGGRSDGPAILRWEEPVVEAREAPVAALAEPPAGRSDPGIPGRPDIYVLILDAARADAFSPYGAGRPTPAIQDLADDGTVFLQAYTPAPWTGQAIPSLFSGRYPEAHGVETWGWALSDSIPTLAEVVAQAGYHTVLWTQHAIYAGNRTLRRGFDVFVEGPREEPGVIPGGDDLFLEGYPTFAVVHWLPPHAPYTPPEPFRGRYSGWRQGELAADAPFLNRFPHQARPESLDAEHLRYVRDRYDEHVRYADDIVGRFVDVLRDAGRYDDALIVVVSDHGEAFLEHGYFLHTRFLYEEVLRVPLVLKWPAGTEVARRRVTEPVSTIQLVPTVVEGLGLDRPDVRAQAGSLLTAARSDTVTETAVYFSTRGVAPPERQPRPEWGLRAGRFKVVWDDADGLLELYDLEADPGERDNLVPGRPRLAAFLRQQADLQRHRNRLLLLAETPAGAVQELDTETLERLRALGYIQ